MTTLAAFNDLLRALDAFADMRGTGGLSKVVTARMRLMEAGDIDKIKWPGVAKAIVALCVAAQEATGRPDRLAFIAEMLAVAVQLWRADLGEEPIKFPKAPPAPIRQYKDD